MKRIFINIGLSVLFLSLFSCYKDKGNYDYHEIGEITIEDVEDNYRVIAYMDVLELSPKVASTDPNDVLEYCWTLDKKSSGSLGDEKIKVDTIGNDKDLNFPVELKKGDYNLTLFVTNHNTGFQVHKEMDLFVETPFSRGFYVLKELDGNSELDLHLSDTEKMENVLTEQNEGPVPGKPVSLGMSFDYYFVNKTSPEFQCANTLNICTENDLRIVNVGDLSTVFNYDEMFFTGEIPAGEKPYYMFSSGFGVGFATNTGFYHNLQYGESSGMWGLPVSVEEGNSCNKYIVSDGSNAYFFDTKNRRFLMCDFNSAVESFKEGGAYSPNNVPYDFVYMGRCDIAGGGYAIFNDTEEPTKRYLYKLDLGNGTINNPITEVKEIDPLLNTNRAEMFACNELEADIIYAVVDNKIYAYEPLTNTETEIVPQGLETDEEITGISYRFWLEKDDEEYNFKHLIICTYKDGNYKVYLYDLVGKQTYGAPKHVFAGTGKAIKLHYASPKQLGMLSSYKELKYSLSF